MKRWLCLALSALLALVALAPAASAPTKPKPKPPQIVRHRDVTVEATGPNGAIVTYLPATVKNVQGVRSKSVTYSKASGTLFPLGKTIVTITARNAAGITRSKFVVNVVDTTPPTFAATPDITTRATSAAGAVVTYGPVRATDLVDRNPSVTCSPPSGSVFPPGATTVNCSARDAAGNKATASFKVVVQANSPPEFPSPMTTSTSTSYQYDAAGRLTGVTTTITVSAAVDPDGDPLTYEWTATNGSIVASGVNATWTRLIQSGRVATGSVVVTARDPWGGSDTFTIDFR